MSPDPVRPDGDVAVRVVAAFTDVAARAALHAGERPVRELSFWLTPDSPHWSDAVDLLPEVPDDTDHVLVVQPEYSAHLKHVTATERRWWQAAAAGEPVPYWRHPRIVVNRGSEPQPLEMWPENTAALLQLAAEAEKRITTTVDLAIPELEAATRQWSEGLADRLVRWEELVEIWKSNDFIFEDFLETGSAQGELPVLEKALRRLRDHIERDDHLRPTDQDRSLPFSTLAGITSELATADDAMHDALDVTVARVLDGLREQRQANERRSAQDEAASWVAEHGSDRLKMAVEAGILHQAMGAYRDERLRAEHPGWMWVDRDDTGELDNKAMNPSEDAIRLLLQARSTTDEKAYLAYHVGQKLQFLVAGFLGRPIWRPVDSDWTAENLERYDTLTVSVYDALVRNAPPVAYDDAEEPF